MTDVTPEYFREQARRCSRLAADTTDDVTAAALLRLDTEYNRKAADLEKGRTSKAMGGDLAFYLILMASAATALGLLWWGYIIFR